MAYHRIVATTSSFLEQILKEVVKYMRRDELDQVQDWFRKRHPHSFGTFSHIITLTLILTTSITSQIKYHGIGTAVITSERRH